MRKIETVRSSEEYTVISFLLGHYNRGNGGNASNMGDASNAG